MEQPHVEEKRVEEPTHVETSKDGRKYTREVDRLIHDSREYMGSSTSQRYVEEVTRLVHWLHGFDE